MTLSTAVSEKRILLLYTGGTIGMVNSERGNPASPLVPGSYERLQEYLPIENLRRHKIGLVYPNREIVPKDSSDIGPDDWTEFVDAIYSEKDHIDGVVVLHGTDTMHYTAAALSFMLEGLPFPVVMTGAYNPISYPRTDGQQNIVSASQIAAGLDIDGEIPLIPEVCIYTFLDHRIHRGNRTVEITVGGGYDSPNYTELGTVGSRISISSDRILPQPEEGTPFNLNTNSERGILYLSGPAWTILQTLRRSHLIEGRRALLVGKDITRYEEPFKELLDTLAETAKSGKFVGLIAESFGGLDATSGFRSRLSDYGIAYGHDMVFPAALTKTMHLLGNYDIDKARELFGKNLRGELSGPLYRGR